MKNNKISRLGFLLAVSNMERARNFYVAVMEQKIVSDDGSHNVAFESGICLQYDYIEMIEGGELFAARPTGVKLEMKPKSNSYQIGLEVEDFDYWVAKIKSVEGIEIIHDVTEYLWGQRVIRFYDYDGHIIEIGESLESVAKRFISQGLTIEEVVERFGFSLEFVQGLLSAE